MGKRVLVGNVHQNRCTEAPLGGASEVPPIGDRVKVKDDFVL